MDAKDYIQFGAGYGIPAIKSPTAQGGYSDFKYQKFIEVVANSKDPSKKAEVSKWKNLVGRRLYFNILTKEDYNFSVDVKNLNNSDGGTEFLDYSLNPTLYKFQAIISLSELPANIFIPIADQTLKFLQIIRDAKALINLQTTNIFLEQLLIKEASLTYENKGEQLKFDIDVQKVQETLDSLKNKDNKADFTPIGNGEEAFAREL